MTDLITLTQDQLVEYCVGEYDKANYSIPIMDELECLKSDSTEPLPKWLEITGDYSDNHIFISPQHKCPHPLKLSFHQNAKGNVIIIGASAEIYGSLNIHGSNNVICLGNNSSQWSMLTIRLWSNNQVFIWGEGSSSNGCDVIMQGDGKKVLIGDDCMFANNIFIRNSDMHPIVDLKTKKWLNQPKNVVLERHVWVCQEALILKGVNVGYGSIIGAKSLVNKSVSKCSLVAGNPASLLRSAVSWDRPEKPRDFIVDEIHTNYYKHININEN